MSMKGDIHKTIESFRLKFDLYQMVSLTAKEIFQFLLPTASPVGTKEFIPVPVGSEHSVEKVLDCILCLLIESSKKPALDIYASTYYTNGIPVYFMGILDEQDILRLESLGALDMFGQPLDSY